MRKEIKVFTIGTVAMAVSFFSSADGFAKPLAKPVLSAKSAIVVDPDSSKILYSKNAHLRLPPASTTKVMTAVIALESLPLDRWVVVSRRASAALPSKAGLTPGAKYRVKDLILATLVSSSNDAAVALAEAVSKTEKKFVYRMNLKALALGMHNTRFVNATGLPEKKGPSQFTTAFDLAKLMRYALRDKRIDQTLGVTTGVIRGSDGKNIFLKNHNKMLWRMPKFVKGKTGWTQASKHTFVGTDYKPDKRIVFAMLSSQKPWLDIERLASFGLRLKNRLGN